MDWFYPLHNWAPRKAGDTLADTAEKPSFSGGVGWEMLANVRRAMRQAPSLTLPAKLDHTKVGTQIKAPTQTAKGKGNPRVRDTLEGG